MAPQEFKSFQDAWTVYNDGDPTAHVPLDTRPINFEIYQTSYVWGISTLQDIVFFKFEIKNKHTDTLKDVYVGLCCDNDVGNYSDDINGLRLKRTYIVGSETLRMDNVAFTTDNNYTQGWGCVAYDYLQSPYALNDGKDNDREKDSIFYGGIVIVDTQEVSKAFFQANIPPSKWDGDLDGLMDWEDPSCIEQYGMTAFRQFTIDIDPRRDWERYLVMAGYDYRTRIYDPYDSFRLSPGDMRFVMSTGKITLPPESSTVVLVAVIGAKYPEVGGMPDDSFDLARKSSTAQYIYDHNWLLPGPPVSPNLVCVPGDHKVTLIWDNLSEVTPDPYFSVVSDPSKPNYDPFYQQYDFRGYRIWRSITGIGNDWNLIKTFDLADGDTFTYTDPAIPESIKIVANDNGVMYTYVDTTVRNGFTYFYAVTAYDHNFVKIIDSLGDTTKMSLIFEGGRRAIPTAPRTNAANVIFTPPKFVEAKLLSGNPDAQLNIDALFPNPYMTHTKYTLTFDSIMGDTTDFRLWAYTDTSTGVTSYYVHPVYKWKLRNYDLPDSVLTGAFSPQPKSGNDYAYPLDTVFFPVFKNDGVQLRFIFNQKIPANDTTIIKDIEFVRNQGGFPDTWPRSTGLEVLEQGYTTWAYTGEDYEIQWDTIPGGFVTCRVKEIRTGRYLPYTPCSLTNSAETSITKVKRIAMNGAGWFFRGGYIVSGQFVPTDTIHRETRMGRGTKYMYIAGLRFAMKIDGSSMAPGDPVPAVGDIWRVIVGDSMKIPPLQSYEIKIDTALIALDNQKKLNVKVVPNPYLITNEWQRSRYQRKLKFINLPPECTIRIFTTNGELIKTLKHSQRLKGSAQPNELGGDEWWDLLTEYGQMPASGVYIFHVYAKDVGEQVGKFVIIQ
ncbi:MAG: hypothetical protein ABIK18_04110 [candidate division WOR-3 bacterium]